MSTQREIYVFIGPPGSGKGTLSGLCIQKFGWKQLSTGNLCRKHIANQTKIGKKIDFAIKSGKLISDSLITSIVADWFKHAVGQVQTVILDGYPRTIEQAQAFNKFLASGFNFLKLYVICFSISDQSVISRLNNRYICKNKDCQTVYSLMATAPLLAPKKAMFCDICSSLLERRKDDTETAVRERLDMYYQHEQKLLDFYKKVNQPVHKIDVDKSLDQIFKEFKCIIGLKAV